ncbi:Chorismate synthase [Musa troglodytarum]|uniref:Chorismate synthase n=1 Tax=Musa troglodytarum TaxID=320322 RepID=A0A9E7JER3_9LILI|nr:Chorismate synthase [Musa troglodytarum]
MSSQGPMSAAGGQGYQHNMPADLPFAGLLYGCRSTLYRAVVWLRAVTTAFLLQTNSLYLERINEIERGWWQTMQVAKEAASSSTEQNNDEQEQITIARALLNYRLKEKIAMANNPHATPFPKKFPVQLDKKPASLQSPLSVSKILPLIRQNSIPRGRATSRGINDGAHASYHQQAENHNERPQNFPVAAAAPYFPVRPFSRPCHGMAPPVTIRTAVPVFSAPPLPPPPSQVCQQRLPVIGHTQIRMASPVRIRQSVPVFSAPPRVPPVTSVIPVQVKEPLPVVSPPSLDKDPVPVFASALPVQVKESVPVATASPSVNEQSPVTAPAVPVLVKEPLSSIQAHEPSVLLLACPAAKPSSQIEDFVDSRDAKDLEESESTAMESLKRLEIC